MPKSSRRMCGIGFSETWPPSKAVVSPPIFATRACAASWHVVESRNTTYSIKPNASRLEFMGVFELEQPAFAPRNPNRAGAMAEMYVRPAISEEHQHCGEGTRTKYQFRKRAWSTTTVVWSVAEPAGPSHVKE